MNANEWFVIGYACGLATERFGTGWLADKKPEQLLAVARFLSNLGIVPPPFEEFQDALNLVEAPPSSSTLHRGEKG